MRSKKKQVIQIGSALLVVVLLGMTGLWIRGLQSQGSALAWGGPSLCVSERDYCMTQIDTLLQGWKSGGFGNMPPRSGEEESLLAIDLDQHVMWVDPPKVPWQREGVALPASLAWTLYHRCGNETVTLPRFVCLKPFRVRTGTVALVGRARNGMHLTCILSGSRQGMIAWKDRAFDPNSLSGGRPQQTSPSVVITDEAELKRIAQHRPNQATALDTPPLKTNGLDAKTQNRLAWEALQKPLYQALEKQATDRGYDVTCVTAYPGPDLTAGMAGVAVQNKANRGFWQRLFNTSLIGRPFLLFTVEAQGNGLWQCRSTDSATRGTGRGPVWNFKVQAPDMGSTVTDKPLEPSLGESRWSVLLDGGTQVELIGVYTDQGQTWWAPDGSALDAWPGFSRQPGGTGMIMHDLITSRHGTRNMTSMMPAPDRDRDKRCFAVLRVPSALGFSNSSGSSSSGSTAVYFGGSPFIDRFGQPQFPGQYIVLTFDPQTDAIVSHGLGIHVLQNPQERPGIIRSDSRNRASGGVTVGGGLARGGSLAGGGGRNTALPANVRALLPPDMSEPSTGNIDDTELQWIHLENLSLQANQKTDFRMTVSEEPLNSPSTSRVQVLR